MLISKISNSTFTSNSFNSTNCCKPKPYVNLNSGLHQDTVSFTANSKQMNEVMSLVFEKLSQSRKGRNNGTFIGTTKDNVDIHIRETLFGKNAQLTLTNFNFRNKNFAMFELKRSSGAAPQIISMEDNKEFPQAADIIKKHLLNLK